MSHPRKKQRIPANDNVPLGRLYSPGEAADLLGLAPQTLAHWRVRGTGPKYCLLSRRCVRYSEQALKDWMDSRTQDSTVENDRHE